MWLLDSKDICVDIELELLEGKHELLLDLVFRKWLIGEWCVSDHNWLNLLTIF